MKCRIVLTTAVMALDGKPRTFVFDVEAQNAEAALAGLNLTAEWLRIPDHPHIAEVRTKQISFVEVLEPVQDRQSTLTFHTVRAPSLDNVDELEALEDEDE
jgi:hypothetical protein